VAKLLQPSRANQERSAAAAQRDSITALGGRIEGLSTRPSARGLEEAKAAVADASTAHQHWRDEHGPAIDAWGSDAQALGIPSSADATTAIADALVGIDRRIARQNQLVVEMEELETQLEQQRSSLRAIQEQLADAQEQAGSLAEGLAALREHASDDVCPVCDRAFGEVSSTHLTTHIDRKIAELTTQGEQLRRLRAQRDAAMADVQRGEQALEQARGQLLTDEQLNEIGSRRAAVASVQERLQKLQPSIETLRTRESTLRNAEAKLRDLQSIAQDANTVTMALENLARELNVPQPRPDQSLEDAWRTLAEFTDQRVAAAETLAAAYASAGEKLAHMRSCTARVDDLKDAVAAAAERKSVLEARVKEARRRQSVAREVQHAASQARAEIVHRVFTESLNDVWRSVFTRLAPREDFVPTFGIPTSSRTSLELTLGTVHTSGTAAGSPQLMLSAGNLNTAALSLFIALHLAVEPLVPCLVFDDPVQSMDEIHIAQFAGLMRVLSKQHGRQIIIAVHERELFEYLALELSPAFEGDELITIELGTTPDDADRGVQRIGWVTDPAIAV
jgi:exonuclease SbcC